MRVTEERYPKSKGNSKNKERQRAKMSSIVLQGCVEAKASVTVTKERYSKNN